MKTVPPQKPEKWHYVPQHFSDVHWIISNNSLVMLGDHGNNFVKTQLSKNIFSNYMLLYLHYLSIYLEYWDVKAELERLKDPYNKYIPEQIVRLNRFADNVQDELANQRHSKHFNDMYLQIRNHAEPHNIKAQRCKEDLG